MIDASAVKAHARLIGFDLVGITTAEDLPDAERAMSNRVAAGMLDGMPWFTRQRARLACRPRERFPWTKSVISLAYPYVPANTNRARGGESRATATEGSPCGRHRTPTDPTGSRMSDSPAMARSYANTLPNVGLVSRYAAGEDYHRVLGRKLKELASFLAAHGAKVKAYVDTGPVAERALGVRAGLGWLGKNTNLLTPRYGSWVFLAEIFTDLSLEPDGPLKKSCGKCTRCLEACPTGALVAPYVLDSRRCISFLTIELRGSIPRDLRSKLGNIVFGCDICQEVCPVNERSDKPPPETLDLLGLLSMTDAGFGARFPASALRRAGLPGLRRNAIVAFGNSLSHAAVQVLSQLLHSSDPMLRAHAAWALGRAGGAGPVLRQALTTELDNLVREEIVAALL